MKDTERNTGNYTARNKEKCREETKEKDTARNTAKDTERNKENKIKEILYERKEKARRKNRKRKVNSSVGWWLAGKERMGMKS